MSDDDDPDHLPQSDPWPEFVHQSAAVERGELEAVELEPVPELGAPAWDRYPDLMRTIAWTLHRLDTLDDPGSSDSYAPLSTTGRGNTVGIIDSVKKLRSNDRHAVLGEPKPGVQSFAYRDCKSQQVKRYCELAEESGFVVDLASSQEARSYERLLDEAGVGVGRSWHVLVWRPGEERPGLQIDPRNVSQPPGSPDS